MSVAHAWEGSAANTHAVTSDRLPEEVTECLKHARFLHLATCTADFPHVSLMNYTYLPSHPFPNADASLPAGPFIIMTSNPASKKALNLVQNPNVSLLVHDWVSSRPPAAAGSNRDYSPTSGLRSSSLANMLMQMNSEAVSSISVTMNGTAKVLQAGTDAEKWCKEQHLANNTFDPLTEHSRSQLSSLTEQPRTPGDGGRGSYIAGDDVRVVVVQIKGGRISDWKGNVKDFLLASSSDEAPLVNGVTN